MTRIEHREAYRIAVEICLTRFFDQSPMRAAQLTQAWWERLASSADFASNLFLHEEPMHTAADLMHTIKAPSIARNREAYETILRDSLSKARKELAGKPLQSRTKPARRADTTVKPGKLRQVAMANAR
jgi:hypothetical protein